MYICIYIYICQTFALGTKFQVNAYFEVFCILRGTDSKYPRIKCAVWGHYGYILNA